MIVNHFGHILKDLAAMKAILAQTNKEDLPPHLEQQIASSQAIVMTHHNHYQNHDTALESVADDMASLSSVFSKVLIGREDETLGIITWRTELHARRGNILGELHTVQELLRAQGLVPSAIQDLPLDIAVNDYAGQVRALHKRVEALDAGFKTFQSEVENQKNISADQSQVQNFGLINFSNSKIKIQINILNNLTLSHNKIDLKSLARAIEHLAKAVKGVGTAIRKFPQQISGALVKAYDAMLKPMTTKVVDGGKTLFKWVVRQYERRGRIKVKDVSPLDLLEASTVSTKPETRDPRGVFFAGKWWPWETEGIYTGAVGGIADFTPRIKLSQKIIDIDRIPIIEFTPLKDLINLKELDLSYTHITDLTPLKHLANLQRLSLSRTQITDITSLKDLTNLQCLYLSDTKINDITPLKDLTNLQVLFLYSTNIIDIAPLKNLANLQILWLSNTQITNITPLKNLTNLQSLYLRSTHITDITPLKDLTILQVLDLSDTKITDITLLKNLTNLQRLYQPDGKQLEGQPAIQKAIKNWRPKT